MTENGSKSLKDQYRAQLWLVIALNVIVFHAVLRAGPDHCPRLGRNCSERH